MGGQDSTLLLDRISFSILCKRKPPPDYISRGGFCDILVVISNTSTIPQPLCHRRHYYCTILFAFCQEFFKINVTRGVPPWGGGGGGTLRPQSPLVPTAVDFLVVFALLALGMWFSSILDCMLQYSVNFLWKTVNFRTY